MSDESKDHFHFIGRIKWIGLRKLSVDATGIGDKVEVVQNQAVDDQLV